MRTSSRRWWDRCGFTLLGRPLVRARAWVEYMVTSTCWRRPLNAKARSSPSLRSTGRFKIPLSEDAQEASRFTGAGDSRRSHGGATVAPLSTANRKTRGKSAQLAHEPGTHQRGAMTVRAFVPTWDELGNETATAGARFTIGGQKPKSDGAATVAAP